MAETVYKIFNKNSKGSVIKFIPNQQLQINVINQLSENLKEEEIIHHLKTILGVDLADMRLISKYNEGIRYLLCATDLYSKYAWVVPLLDKTRVTFVTFDLFKSILNSSKHKANKI